MRDPESESTPKGQILPSEPDSNASILQNLRKRRDQRALGRRSAPSPAGESPHPVPKFGPAIEVPKHLSKPPNYDQITADVQALDATEPSRVVPAADTTTPSPSASSRATTCYSQTSPVFAVDVSWSTHNGVLDEEKLAVRSLSKRLSPSTAANARIIPWSSVVDPPFDVSQVDMLYSRGGTEPQYLTSDRTSLELLKACSLWFLLTDGAIAGRSIQRFAQGVSAASLHGKACVIILFGYRQGGPLSCNISVGQAVFALAPDCAFLFYDVDSTELFVFQCKGCFRKLLPGNTPDIILDAETRWAHLPRTTWDELAGIDIPNPLNLGANSILLKSGREIDVEELYGNRLTQGAIADILDYDDNIKSIILNAQSRGRSKDMARWISKQKISRNLPERFDRPDLNGNAANLINNLVTGMRSASLDREEEKSMKRRLREAHLANWTSFLVSAESMKDQAAQRNTVLEDAMSRVELSRESPGSPVMLSPVSPRPGSSRFRPSPPPPPKPHVAQFPQPSPPNIYPHRRQGIVAQQHGLDSRGPYKSPNWREESYTERNYLPSPFPENPEMSKLLWMKGYTLESRWSASEACRGRCSLCEDETSPLALLLKAKPSDCFTEGDFPSPQSYQQIIYPMAMGNFPETDVISSFLCCEKCAYFVRRLGFSPLDDKITGAIPLISNSEGQNRRIKLQEIDVALEGRFDTAIVDQIFLSVLYEKLDDVIKTGLPETDLFAKALRWEAKNLGSTVLLHTELSTCFDSPQETVGKEPLSWAMSSQLQKVAPIVSMDLLRYPVGGFVTLLKGYLDDDRVFQAEDTVMKAVFQRLVFHFAEQHYDLREDIGLELAAQELGRVLSGESGGLVLPSFRAEVEALEGTYLLEPDAVESFRRLQPWFGSIERDCAPAIRLFLQLMLDLPWKDGPAEEMLSLVPLIDKSFDLLERPWTLDEEKCQKMLMS